MQVKIPSDDDFDFYSCRKLYKKYQKLIGDDASFNQIIKNTFFYAFYDNKTLVGCIYLFEGVNEAGVNEEGVNSVGVNQINGLFMNGFANRGFHSFNIKAVKKIFDWFDTDIYAKSVRKPARYLLLKCGFKKISQNLFVYYNNGLSRKGN